MEQNENIQTKMTSGKKPVAAPTAGSWAGPVWVWLGGEPGGWGWGGRGLYYYNILLFYYPIILLYNFEYL